MVTGHEEVERREVYDARYRAAFLAANVQVERESVGTDYGNSGYTTLAQADQLIDVLQLDKDDLVLDLGSGAGWPGLYLSKQTGCRVVVSDLSAPGVQYARRRAVIDRITPRTAALVASARRLPFRPDSFDAMVHSDVLC